MNHICFHLFVGTSLLLTEDGADLDSIEAVANEVLKMEMPSTPQQLQNLTEDIRERVESLSQVEVILQQSAADIARAEMLLEEAKKARYPNIWHFKKCKKIFNQQKFLRVSVAYFRKLFFKRNILFRKYSTFFTFTHNILSHSFTQQKCNKC